MPKTKKVSVYIRWSGEALALCDNVLPKNRASKIAKVIKAEARNNVLVRAKAKNVLTEWVWAADVYKAVRWVLDTMDANHPSNRGKRRYTTEEAVAILER